MIVSVQELKDHLRIQHSEEDNLLADLILQAQTHADNFCRVKWDEADDVPASVRLATLLMASFYYENRDVPDRQTYRAMKEAWENLLYPCRDEAQMF